MSSSSSSGSSTPTRLDGTTGVSSPSGGTADPQYVQDGACGSQDSSEVRHVIVDGELVRVEENGVVIWTKDKSGKRKSTSASSDVVSKKPRQSTEEVAAIVRATGSKPTKVKKYSFQEFQNLSEVEYLQANKLVKAGLATVGNNPGCVSLPGAEVRADVVISTSVDRVPLRTERACLSSELETFNRSVAEELRGYENQVLTTARSYRYFTMNERSRRFDYVTCESVKTLVTPTRILGPSVVECADPRYDEGKVVFSDSRARRIAESDYVCLGGTRREVKHRLASITNLDGSVPNTNLVSFFTYAFDLIHGLKLREEYNANVNANDRLKIYRRREANQAGQQVDVGEVSPHLLLVHAAYPGNRLVGSHYMSDDEGYRAFAGKRVIRCTEHTAALSWVVSRFNSNNPLFYIEHCVVPLERRWICDDEIAIMSYERDIPVQQAQLDNPERPTVDEIWSSILNVARTHKVLHQVLKAYNLWTTLAMNRVVRQPFNVGAAQYDGFLHNAFSHGNTIGVPAVVTPPAHIPMCLISSEEVSVQSDSTVTRSSDVAQPSSNSSFQSENENAIANLGQNLRLHAIRNLATLLRIGASATAAMGHIRPLTMHAISHLWVSVQEPHWLAQTWFTTPEDRVITRYAIDVLAMIRALYGLSIADECVPRVVHFGYVNSATLSAAFVAGPRVSVINTFCREFEDVTQKVLYATGLTIGGSAGLNLRDGVRVNRSTNQIEWLASRLIPRAKWLDLFRTPHITDDITAELSMLMAWLVRIREQEVRATVANHLVYLAQFLYYERMTPDEIDCNYRWTQVAAGAEETSAFTWDPSAKSFALGCFSTFGSREQECVYLPVLRIHEMSQHIQNTILYTVGRSIDLAATGMLEQTFRSDEGEEFYTQPWRVVSHTIGSVHTGREMVRPTMDTWVGRPDSGGVHRSSITEGDDKTRGNVGGANMRLRPRAPRVGQAVQQPGGGQAAARPAPQWQWGDTPRTHDEIVARLNEITRDRRFYLPGLEALTAAEFDAAMQAALAQLQAGENVTRLEMEQRVLAAHGPPQAPGMPGAP